MVFTASDSTPENPIPVEFIAIYFSGKKLIYANVYANDAPIATPVEKSTNTESQNASS